MNKNVGAHCNEGIFHPVQQISSCFYWFLDKKKTKAHSAEHIHYLSSGSTY